MPFIPQLHHVSNLYANIEIAKQNQQNFAGNRVFFQTKIHDLADNHGCIRDPYQQHLAI